MSRRRWRRNSRPLGVSNIMACAPAAMARGTSPPNAACAGYDGGDYGGYSYYDGYYDNYYGPVSYGYWGPDNDFYYSTVVGGPYARDEAHHSRRDGADGWRRFHMRGRRPPDSHG